MLRSRSASAASSVKIAPPSPKQPSGLAGKKLVAVARPKVPSRRPLYVAPNDCAASSSTNNPSLLATSAIASWSAL
ncbi:Uncharacterised protein [Mycobacterium tuberculosis]|nr:Uncharacterised protein [Mycobacterium tuberculosis]